MLNSPGPSAVTIAMASSRYGKARRMSVVRMRRSSRKPPKKPATSPSVTPATAPIAVATMTATTARLTAVTRSGRLAMADPGIEDGVGEVGQQVDEDERGRHDE